MSEIDHQKIVYWLGVVTSVLIIFSLAVSIYFFYLGNPHSIGRYYIPIWTDESKDLVEQIILRVIFIIGGIGLARGAKLGWALFVFSIVLDILFTADQYIIYGFEEEGSHVSLFVELLIYSGLFYYLTSDPILEKFDMKTKRINLMWQFLIPASGVWGFFIFIY